MRWVGRFYVTFERKEVCLLGTLSITKGVTTILCTSLNTII